MSTDLWEKWKNRCAWCGKQIPEEEEVWGVGAKARAGLDTSRLEGPIIELRLRDRMIPAIITRGDSPAKREGYDFAFMACSAECIGDLRDALQREIDILDDVMRIG